MRLFLLMLLFSSLVNAREAETGFKCAEIYAKHDNVFSVNVTPVDGVNLRFSAPVRHRNIGEPDLWAIVDSTDTSMQGVDENELFVKPKLAGLTTKGEAIIRYNGFDPRAAKDEKDMFGDLQRNNRMDLYKVAVSRFKRTNLHVKLDTPARTHYSIWVNVVANETKVPPCYVVIDTEVTEAVAKAGTKPKGRALSDQQYRDAMVEAHDHMHTLYEVAMPDEWTAARITSVYDNGRFTYVKLDSAEYERNKAPITFFANVDGNRHLVQSDLEPKAEEPFYRIHGVFVDGLFAVQGVHGEDSVFSSDDGNVAEIRYKDKALAAPVAKRPARVVQPENNNMGTF